MAYLLIQLVGCAFVERILPGRFSTTAAVQVDKIDEKKAIVRYDYGPSVHTDGRQSADKAIHDFCGSLNYRIITEGQVVKSSQRWTKTLIVECLNHYELHINY